MLGVERALETMSLSGRTDRGIVRDMLAQLGHDDTPELRRRITESYLRHLPDFLHRIRGRVLPGIAALLETLARQDSVALGLLTIFAYGGSYFSVTVLAPSIVTETGWPLSWVVGGLSLQLLVCGLVMPFAGRRIERDFTVAPTADWIFLGKRFTACRILCTKRLATVRILPLPG